MQFIELTDKEKNRPILINTEHIIFVREFSYKDFNVTRLWIMPNEDYVEVLEPYEEIRKMICPQLSDLVDELFGDTIVAKEEVK